MAKGRAARFVSDRDARTHFEALAKALVARGVVSEQDIHNITKTALDNGQGFQGAMDALIPIGNDYLATRSDRGKWGPNTIETPRKGRK